MTNSPKFSFPRQRREAAGIEQLSSSELDAIARDPKRDPDLRLMAWEHMKHRLDLAERLDWELANRSQS